MILNEIKHHGRSIRWVIADNLIWYLSRDLVGLYRQQVPETRLWAADEARHFPIRDLGIMGAHFLTLKGVRRWMLGRPDPLTPFLEQHTAEVLRN